VGASPRELSEVASPPAAAAAVDHVWTAVDQLRESFRSHPASLEPAMTLPLVYQPFWAMFAEFDLEELSRIPFGLPLMWVYVLIANIVLVNMLIAMFADTYARIKTNALQEYHFQHYMYIFEYQHLVHAVPPPFNFPLLLWDSCVSCFRSREFRRNQARLFLDDGYDEDPTYGAPQGVDREEGLSLMRKYVQRYLQANGDLTSAMDIMSLTKRIEGNMYDLEERMMHEFEHIHNSLIAPMGSGAKLDQKLSYITIAIDRMLKGKNHEVASAVASGMKDKMRGASNVPQGQVQSQRPPTPPPKSKR